MITTQTFTYYIRIIAFITTILWTYISKRGAYYIDNRRIEVVHDRYTYMYTYA